MTWRRTAKAVAMFAMLVALHFLLRPLLGWRVSMDFLVIAVLLTAVRVRPGTAALVGFLTGLTADAIAPTSFGAGALGMTVVGFGASWLKAVFFADNVLLHAFYFFAGKWVFDLVYTLAGARGGAADVIAQLLVWSPLAALATAISGVVIILVFRTMLEPQTT
jgi:rod shape-determining protein MreD